MMVFPTPNTFTIAAPVTVIMATLIWWLFRSKTSSASSSPVKFEGPKKDDICAICLSPPSDPSRLSCGHTFCKVCIEQMRKHAFRGRLNDACPICRVPLEDTAEKVFMEAVLMMVRENRINELVEVGGESESYQTDGTMRNVQRSLERALKLDENHPGALICLGEILLANNKPKRAEQLLRLAIEIDDTHASAFLALGKSLQMQNKQLADAMEAYERAISVAENSGSNDMLSMSCMKMAMAQEEDGNLDASIRFYNRAATANPTNFLIPFNMGVTLEEADIDGAITAYKKACSLKPDFYPTNFALTTAYKRRIIANAHDNSRKGQFKRGKDAQRWIGAALSAKRLASNRTQLQECNEYLQEIEKYFPASWRAYQLQGDDEMMGMM